MLLAFEAGPLPGFTGGFGEPTCLKCHFDNAPNDRAGSLRLSGLPRSYTPGESYVITILLSRPELRRGGFQLSARFASGAERGADAGQLRPADERTSLIASQDGRIHYAQHAQAGSKPAAPGAIAWQVEWRAPAAAEAVAFHVAANAANDDASPLGDFVYWTAATRSARRVGSR